MKGYARAYCVARCHDCDWYSECVDTGSLVARRHHISTGHEVSIDLVFTKLFRGLPHY